MKTIQNKLANKLINLLVYKSNNVKNILDKVECGVLDSLTLKHYYHNKLKNIVNKKLNIKNTKIRPANLLFSKTDTFNFNLPYSLLSYSCKTGKNIDNYKKIKSDFYTHPCFVGVFTDEEIDSFVNRIKDQVKGVINKFYTRQFNAINIMNITINDLSLHYDVLENLLYFDVGVTTEYHFNDKIPSMQYQFAHRIESLNRESHEEFIKNTAKIIEEIEEFITKDELNLTRNEFSEDHHKHISLTEELKEPQRDDKLSHNPIHGNTSIFSSFV